MPQPSVSTHPGPGVFVVFEGGDGAGKTTQIALLQQWFVQQEREVVLTREPGGTELGASIRQVLLHGDDVAPRAEALLFAADRAHHVATVVRPALERGAVVLQDRYMDSSIAYQGAGRELDASDVRRLSVWATGGLLPHLTVLLDVDPAVGRRRRGGAEDRLEREADTFHARVREHYLDLAAADPQRYLVVDAALPKDEIAARVSSAVAALGQGPRDE
ncbi:dTMP kinase [Leekyejoonella antrihumi]|uniref:Thymidylate kinase n=1 Tax=Leekyejoonella antrihumi TaxID=1660198 RepID=A0A563DVS2_9MICO|nr:dTMP kinase [Leekyejoonella antrihumi]TWP34295.1 dTMP kinase [Leekyejoonella antrihumi]